MNKLHLIAGLPRSGSTLLCQILNMHSDHFATPTSPMLDMLTAQQAIFSHDGGFKAVDRLAVYNDFAEAQKAFLETYYKDHNIVFDKNRGWPMHLMKLDEILGHEETKIIWTYRNPLEVVASMEYQHRKYPLIQYIDEQAKPGALSTMDARIGHWINDNGIINIPSRALHEATVNGYESRIKIIEYSNLCKNPQETMEKIHEFLGLEKYQYDAKEWKDLKQTTHEFDNLYNYKFPHTIVEGKIEYSEHDMTHLHQYIETLNKRFEWLISHCEKETLKDSSKRIPQSGRLSKKK